MSKRVLVSCGLALLLTGCVGVPKKGDPEVGQDGMSAVLKRINDGTAQAVQAQQELALTAESKVERTQVNRQRLFTDVISMDFYGDVEDVLAQIARNYDYEFATYGRRPAEGALVNVFVTRKPAIEVLKNVGYQTKWFDVKLTKTAIELHYVSSPRAK